MGTVPKSGLCVKLSPAAVAALRTQSSCFVTVEREKGVNILTNFVVTFKDIERFSIASSMSGVDNLLPILMLVLSYINNRSIFMRRTAFAYVKRRAGQPSPPRCLPVRPSLKSCLSGFL